MREVCKDEDESLLINVGTPELPLHIPYSQRHSVAAIKDQDDNSNVICVKTASNPGEMMSSLPSPASMNEVVSPKTAKLVNQLLTY